MRWWWVVVAVAWQVPSVSAIEVYWDPAVGGNGHFYEVIPAVDEITWNEAQAQAAAMGRHLATITSAEENGFVFTLVDDPAFWSAPLTGNRGPWLGGFQSPDSGGPNDDWTWTTGESWGYTSWASGQPNDAFGRKEDKLHFYEPAGGGMRSPTWNDMTNDDPDGKPIAYVTEWIPEPTALSLLAMGGMLLVRRPR